MGSPLRRVFADTRRSFGFTWRSLARSILVPAAAVFLMLCVRGFEGALNEAVDIALYALAFCGAAVIPVFLWNLWLAPYRMLNERLDEATKLQSDSATSRPGPVVVSAYDGTSTFKLGDAACIWVGVQPHCPIADQAAAAMFTKLSGAVMDGDLPRPAGLIYGLSALTGQPLWPRHTHPVSATALRRYAERIGDVPPFLASVQIPESEDSDSDSPKSDEPPLTG